MKTLTKIIALGAAGAGIVALVRSLRAKQSEQELEVTDVTDVSDVDELFVEPVVVTEEVVVITEAAPFDDMEDVPTEGISPGQRY